MLNNAEERQFKRHLEEFWASRGIQNVKIPQIGGRDLDFFQLYKSVIKRGGAQKNYYIFDKIVFKIVSANKLWKEVVNEFGLPPSCTSASFTLRNHYSRYLLAYEQKFFFGKEDSQAITELQGSRTRKLVHMNSDNQYENIQSNQYSNLQQSNPINAQDSIQNIQDNSQNQLKTLLVERYSKMSNHDEINYIKKSRTFPMQSEIKRNILAFESRIQEEVAFSINTLLLYSCNTTYPFLFDQFPGLLDKMVQYMTQIAPQIEYLQISQEINYNQTLNHFKQYEQAGEIYLLEQLRTLFLILRNLSYIKQNDQPLFRSQNLFTLIQRIFMKTPDPELKRYCLEIFSNISKFVQIKNLENADEFLLKLSLNLNHSNKDVLESCLVSLKSLLLIQSNEAVIEIILIKNFEKLNILLLNQTYEIREHVLEILCYLSDLKMSSRLIIAKQPKCIMRLIAIMSSGQGNKNNDKLPKLAGLILGNISAAPTTRSFFLPFESELFIIGASDPQLSNIVSNILALINSEALE